MFEQSGALIGEHLCASHQGNTSHYAPHNCTICQLQAEVAALKQELKTARGLVARASNHQIMHNKEGDTINEDLRNYLWKKKK